MHLDLEMKRHTAHSQVIAMWLHAITSMFQVISSEMNEWWFHYSYSKLQ